MAQPKLQHPLASSGTIAGVQYQVVGEPSPALVTEIADQPVFFEHHIMAWKDPALGIDVKHLQGTFKRSFRGMPIYMVETKGKGEIAFSRGGPGEVLAISLAEGESLNVREHQWLCASSTLDFSFSHVAGVANMLFAGTGLFIDTFSCSTGEGGLWLLGYGNLFEVNLMEGESIDVDPGCWIYKDLSVHMTAVVQRLSMGAFGESAQYVVNRFTGPGRLGIQTMYSQLGSAD
jgi:uncharacterized protein (AIM24 family)